MTLGASARTAFLWGGGSTLLRDVAQFGTMLIMVRILSPSIYGQAALAQSIYMVLGIFSVASFMQHALQLRNPSQVDWQAHFSAAVILNGVLFFLTLLVAWILSFTDTFSGAALPLAVLAVAFLVEIPGNFRLKMLEAHHDWARFRMLWIFGAFLGLLAGLSLALAGAGVYALVVQFPLNLLPAAVDLFWKTKWRPDWSWNWTRYRETFRFGLNRIGATSAGRLRTAVEQSTIAGAWGFSALGIFTRANGLGNIFAGRLGPLAVQAVYPVLTRADARSERYQRMAAVMLQGAWWATVPMVALFCMWPGAIVDILYGSDWKAVAEILPLAVSAIGLTGLGATANSLLLANNQTRTALIVEVLTALLGIGIVLTILTTSVLDYLQWLVMLGVFVNLLAFALLAHGGAVRAGSLLLILVPPFAALPAALAAGYFVTELSWVAGLAEILQLGFSAVVFAFVYLLLLRLAVPTGLLGLLEVAPGGAMLIKLFQYQNSGNAEIREN